jgi:hypothetical protein
VLYRYRLGKVFLAALQGRTTQVLFSYHPRSLSLSLSLTLFDMPSNDFFLLVLLSLNSVYFGHYRGTWRQVSEETGVFCLSKCAPLGEQLAGSESWPVNVDVVSPQCLGNCAA